MTDPKDPVPPADDARPPHDLPPADRKPPEVEVTATPPEESGEVVPDREVDVPSGARPSSETQPTDAVQLGTTVETPQEYVGPVVTTAQPVAPQAILFEFVDPAGLMAAAAQLRDMGLRHWDCHTPFPVHGLDRAMGVKHTILPWIVLACGLTGGLGGLFLQLYTNGVVLPFSLTDFPLISPFLPSGYPYVVSGKPIFSIPANIPVMFETTILLSAFGAFFGNIILNGLPRFHHPVFHSTRFRRATADRFFISIEARDPRFDPAGARELGARLGAVHVEILEG